MKPVPPEKHRVTAEVASALGWPLAVASTSKIGMAGMFLLPNPFAGKVSEWGPHAVAGFGGGYESHIRCMVHDGTGEGEGWEHVSSSFDHRTPRWEEMCLVKDTFWCSDEWVVQFHPAKSDYISNHPFTLHLWRHPSIQTPPKNFV